MSQELEKFSSDKRIQPTGKRPEVFIPPLIGQEFEGVRVFCDEVQVILEDAYGLQSMRLKRASDYLWPRKTSKAVEQVKKVYGDDHSFYIADTAFDILYGEGFHIGRMRQRFLLRAGLLPFDDLHPVIHLPARVLRSVTGRKPAELLEVGSIDNLLVVAEEVGHFLNSQAQFEQHKQAKEFKLRKQFVGQIMGEAVAIVDWYVVLKRIVSDATGTSIFDSTNLQAYEAVRKLIGEIHGRQDIPLDPFTSHYAKSARIIKGFLRHIIERDRDGEDTSAELNHFYLLSAGAKGRYLCELYRKYQAAGYEEYGEYLTSVESRLGYELEFEDEINGLERREQDKQWHR